MKKSRGFTLVEMLIVIAVIGVLAVAVLSAINPVEQMRKARDTRRRSNAAELLNAIERYYTTNEAHPNDFSAGAGVGYACAVAVPGGDMTSSDLATLVNTNEIKPEFTTRIDQSGNELYAALDASTELAMVCYEIESQANITKYAGSSCLDSANIYICLPE